MAGERDDRAEQAESLDPATFEDQVGLRPVALLDASNHGYMLPRWAEPVISATTRVAQRRPNVKRTT